MIGLDINYEAENTSEYAIGIRRILHQYPEMGLKEYKTSGIIKEELTKMSIPFESIAETGIIATIGKNSGRCIALRADMDGLQITEQTNSSYSSCFDGYMHACGHDVHMASLLGAARILKGKEDQLKGCVKLIFQPSEENCAGAKLIVKEGGLTGVEEIFGLHIFTDIKYGNISIEPGVRMAETNNFKIVITGRAGHAGKPHQCIDTTVVGAALVMNMQSIVSRQINPIDSAVITVGKFHSGSQYNIISGEAVLEGTVRTFSAEDSIAIGEAIVTMAENTASTFSAQAKVEYQLSAHPVVINDAQVVKTALDGALTCFSPEQFISIPKMMLGEDFSIYQEQIPGAFAFVGAGKEDESAIFPNHHPCFSPDERVVTQGMKLFVSYVLEALSLR